MADKFSDSMRCFSDWVKAGQQKTNNNTCNPKATPNKEGRDARATFSQTVVMGGTTPFAMEKRAVPLPPLTLKRPLSYSSSTIDESKQNQDQDHFTNDLTIHKTRPDLPAKKEDGPDAREPVVSNTDEPVVSSNTSRVDFARSTTPPGIPRTLPIASTLVDTPASGGGQHRQEQQKEDGNDGKKHTSSSDNLHKTPKAQPSPSPSPLAARPTAPTYSHPVHPPVAGNHSPFPPSPNRTVAALEAQLAASEHAQLLGMAKIRELLAEAKEATRARVAAEAREKELAARLAGDRAAYEEKGELLRHAEELLRDAEEREGALWGAIGRRDARIGGLEGEVEGLKGEVEGLKKGGGGDGGAKRAAAMEEELESLRAENARLKAENEGARANERRNVAQFESLRDYAIDLKKQATDSERLAAKVHRLGEEQYNRAEALREQCAREREAREEAVRWGTKWRDLAEKRAGAAADGAQVVKEAVIDRIYNNLCDLVEEYRIDKGPEGEAATVQAQNGSAAAGSQPADVDMMTAPGTEE